MDPMVTSSSELTEMTAPSRLPHPVIDCHVHVFDPVRFPCTEGVWYRPSGAEIGTADQLERLCDLHMWAQMQVQHDELCPLKEMLVDSGVRLQFDHCDRFVDALVETYTPKSLVWASDWPFIRAPARIDYGPLPDLTRPWRPDPAARQAVLWDTPRRLFGFD